MESMGRPPFVLLTETGTDCLTACQATPEGAAWDRRKRRKTRIQITMAAV